MTRPPSRCPERDPAPGRPAPPPVPARVWLGSGAFLLGQALATVVFALLGLLAAPAPYRRRYALITLWTRINLWWLRVCCGLGHRVRGREHVPSRPGVVLCKHESAWETLALQTLFHPQSWVLKRELLQIPFFGWGLARLRPIAIDRRAGRDAGRQLLRQGRERLAAGSWVVVFPEGTRVPPGARVPFQRGGAVLAKRTGAPVVPVAHDAGDYWPRASFLKRPGTIELVVGPPIDPAGLSADEITRRAEAWIEATLAAIRARPGVPPPGAAGPLTAPPPPAAAPRRAR